MYKIIGKEININSTNAEARRWLKFVDFYVVQCRNEESEAKQFASHTYEAQYYTKLAEMSRHEVRIFRNKAQLAEHKATNDALLSLLTTVNVQTSHSVVKIYESCVQVNEDMAQICDVIVQTIQAYIKANNESFQICGPKASSTSNYDLTPICEAGFIELYQALVSFDKACDSLQNELRLSSSDTRKFTSELYVIEAINCEKESSMYRKQASKYRNYITQCRLNAAPNAIKVESGSSSLKKFLKQKNSLCKYLLKQQIVTLKSIKLHVPCVDATI